MWLCVRKFLLKLRVKNKTKYLLNKIFITFTLPKNKFKSFKRDWNTLNQIAPMNFQVKTKHEYDLQQTTNPMLAYANFGFDDFIKKFDELRFQLRAEYLR